jgi:hypothetical protein
MRIRNAFESKVFMFFMNFSLKFPLQSEVLSSNLIRGVGKHFF